MANSANEAGSGTDVPPPPGAGGQNDGTILQLCPASTGMVAIEMAVAIINAKAVFFKCLPVPCFPISLQSLGQLCKYLI